MGDADQPGAQRAPVGLRLRALEVPVIVDDAAIRMTCSIGIAAMRATPALSVESLLRAADAALYRAKAEGRDRIVVADERVG